MPTSSSTPFRARAGSRPALAIGIILAASLAAASSGCARTRVMKEPLPTAETTPATVGDDAIQLALERVIVRDGPGSWSKRAMWDEYVVHIKNLGDTPLQIERVVLYDAFGHGVEQRFDLRALSRASEQSLAQYKERGIDVKPGASAGLFIAGGTAVAAYGAAAATLGASIGSSAAAVTAGVGIATGGATLLVVGVDRVVQKHRINDRIEERSFGATATIAGEEAKSGSLFFPIVPAPQRLVVSYRTTTGQGEAVVDLREVLAGLHLGAKEASAR